ncbi:MAG: flagellar assembly peptidoglycan hydrolase FlgJ [Gammaproteobacteria bacterium]
MTPDLSAARIYTDFQGLSKLRNAAMDNSPEALQEVAKQFEAIFIQMLLKSMRDASLADGLFDSDQTELYTGMFDQQLAINLGATKSFGIADMLVKQLGNNIESRTDRNPSAKEAAVPGEAVSGTHFKSASEFIESMRPLAHQAAERLGVAPDALLAQAALETGWGQKIIRSEHGRNSFNLFGIKADQRWDGPETTVPSLEYDNGVVRKRSSAFRVYNSYQQSFNDYVDFITQDGRYRQALDKADDAHAYIQALHQAGYATDPEYAKKVIDILDRGVISSSVMATGAQRATGNG